MICSRNARWPQRERILNQQQRWDRTHPINFYAEMRLIIWYIRCYPWWHSADNSAWFYAYALSSWSAHPRHDRRLRAPTACRFSCGCDALKKILMDMTFNVKTTFVRQRREREACGLRSSAESGVRMCWINPAALLANSQKCNQSQAPLFLYPHWRCKHATLLTSSLCNLRGVVGDLIKRNL